MCVGEGVTPAFSSVGSGNIISVLLLVNVGGSVVVLAVERRLCLAPSEG